MLPDGTRTYSVSDPAAFRDAIETDLTYLKLNGGSGGVIHLLGRTDADVIGSSGQGLGELGGLIPGLEEVDVLVVGGGDDDELATLGDDGAQAIRLGAVFLGLRIEKIGVVELLGDGAVDVSDVNLGLHNL